MQKARIIPVPDRYRHRTFCYKYLWFFKWKKIEITVSLAFSAQSDKILAADLSGYIDLCATVIDIFGGNE
jgi:hypothetical protein